MSGPARSARDLGPDDLVWDYFCRGRDEPMVDRVRAAAAAGCDGVGIYLGAWARLRDDRAALDELDAALDETGLVIANIEVVRGWCSPDGPTDECLRMEALAWELADRFGCRYLQAIGDFTGTVEQASAGLASLCDRAADHGLLVGVEAVPRMTNIDSLGLAHRIVAGAERDNAGLCVDSWHLTRSTNDPSDIDALDGSRVFATQFNDGPVAPTIDDYYTDTLTTRVPPGDGEFRLVEMVQALDRIGSRAPIGIEVPSTALWDCPIDEAARRTVGGMREVLARARAGE